MLQVYELVGCDVVCFFTWPPPSEKEVPLFFIFFNKDLRSTFARTVGTNLPTHTLSHTKIPQRQIACRTPNITNHRRF